MNLIPKRVSLVGQVADVLREGIHEGHWEECLPSERALSTQLRVSRPTLRAALAQILREGLIDGVPGSARRILQKSSKPSNARVNIVRLISPSPLQAMPPFVMLWVDEIRERLAEAGYQLETEAQHKYFGRRPARGLEELVRARPAACWVLYLSTAAMQEWFAARGIPCVIAGSCSPGLSLPAVDVNYRAACRHAAGLLMAKGHSRVAFLIESSGTVGDQESENGFKEAFAHTALVPLIIHHDGTPSQIAAKMNALLSSQNPPTAFLVARSTATLTVMSWLMRQGIGLPQKAALISRDSDTYLDFVVPKVARYVKDPALFARKISSFVLSLVEEGSASSRQILIMPSFVKGETAG
ncbi:MAG TPA: substrate-binding domain-containing protein [Verrucomicrobiae bacterium]|jgi:LacI family transcriptional regulator|nr:substrate-binding domain-containing protein [Verrucomicrobiae bacterium]